MHFVVACLMFLTSHVTVCICHAELKGYLLTYLLVVESSQCLVGAFIFAQTEAELRPHDATALTLRFAHTTLYLQPSSRLTC